MQPEFELLTDRGRILVAADSREQAVSLALNDGYAVVLDDDEQEVNWPPPDPDLMVS